MGEPDDQVSRSVSVVRRMLDELRWGEASVFLYNLNKLHPGEWKMVKDRLFSTIDYKQLSTLSTIVECSEKQDLSVCNPLIPGLSQYTNYSENPELFD